MTFAPVPLGDADLATLDRCVQSLARAGRTDDFLALAALTMRLRGAYFASLPNEEFSRRVSENGTLRLLRGGAA